MHNGHGHSPNGAPPYAPRWDAPDHGRYVSKEEYWATWYETEHNYEWNNGYLEAKPMSTLVQILLYQWVLDLLRQYKNSRQRIELMFHEIGFSMTVPDPAKPGAFKDVVRKPDVGVILPTNPMRFQGHERSYQGLCDLCIESLSDSDNWEVTRDTKMKKSEYEFGGVQEYYILDPSGQHMHFYHKCKLKQRRCHSEAAFCRRICAAKAGILRILPLRMTISILKFTLMALLSTHANGCLCEIRCGKILIGYSNF